MKIEIPTHTLKAAALCASAKDIRQYLVSVNVRVTAEKFVIIESTDGFMAFQDRLSFLHEEDAGPFNVLIPLAAVKAAVKAKVDMLTLESMPDGRYMLGDTVFTALADRYPDVDRVFPNRENLPSDALCRLESVQYNPEFLLCARDAMRLALREPKASFSLQPMSDKYMAGLVHCRNKDYPRCAVMPLRFDTLY